MNILFFIGAKIITLLLKLLSKKFKKIKSIYIWARDSTKWWSLFIMII